MCNLFVSADPDLWSSQTRSIRIAGAVTSIRLEKAFWTTLDEIGRRDGYSQSELITTLYNESIANGHDITNFTSFLRVCALRYHSLMANDEIPKSLDVPIADLVVKDILARESARNAGHLAVS